MGRVFRSLEDVIYLKQKNFELGSGSFSSVKLVRHKNDNKKKKYAMKELKRCSAQDIKQVMKEISLHRKFDHPHIIKFEDFIEQNNKVYIFLEYAKNGDLFKFVKKNTLTQKQLLKLFYQTCLGMQYLHNHNIMHRDLKPENILLDDKGNVKICDFGWSAEFREQEIRQTICGTYEYMAPEIFFKKKQSKKTDMWSLGILLYELLHGHAPFQGQRMDQVLLQIQKKIISFKRNISQEEKDLIVQLLSFSPDKRPSIEEVLANDIFKIFITKKKNSKEKNKRKKINPLLFTFTGKENSQKKWKKKSKIETIIEGNPQENYQSSLQKLKNYLQGQQNNINSEKQIHIHETNNNSNKNFKTNQTNQYIPLRIQTEKQQSNISYGKQIYQRKIDTKQHESIYKKNNQVQQVLKKRQQIPNLNKQIYMSQQSSSVQKKVNDQNQEQIKNNYDISSILQKQVAPQQTNIYSKFENRIKNFKNKKKQKIKSFCSSSNLLLYDYKNARKNNKMNSSFSSNKFVNYDFKNVKQKFITQHKEDQKQNQQQEKKFAMDSISSFDSHIGFKTLQNDKSEYNKKINQWQQQQQLTNRSEQDTKNILKFDFQTFKKQNDKIYQTQNCNKFLERQNFKNIYMTSNQVKSLTLTLIFYIFQFLFKQQLQFKL